MSHPTLHPRPSQMPQATFVAHYGDIYEHSPWVAERAWQRGLGMPQDSPDGLAELMAQVLRDADPASQLAVIRAHPDLAGKAAIAGGLTQASTREQAGAGLDQCTPEELARFERLNTAYRARFDFPFVMAVKGSDRHAILDAFATRLMNTPDEERRTAVEQINRIARFRLEARTTLTAGTAEDSSKGK
ncbi:2-oxo-4-hydroxy-4-carboxy-5-ureidoimidazoline decarboxylase [Halomonas sp. TRM85114]|uniref:2-oxo-4-hydroxy-4-carboxy-5-ureidoimidazoline decarboxylase n=1 Tax=Halomonas jincaotanensis TaxID=2810616 RepID=UPI001BD4B02A|nr:2-oxo-4-hydroxy-4-carboxy-5-ureidoimidazoline decarboxylase [Halomonas jincaotanensis]MBS9402740.1 2-oxo-4-hydroxy-4-carboxy-5-ureidoimidazoline decarboxylase [Halomonas jincaotanensis]